MKRSAKTSATPVRPPAQEPSLPQMDLLFPAEGQDAVSPGNVRSNARSPVQPPWKVRELVAQIRRHVEMEYRDVRVEGEISNLRQAASGHIYFTLKDEDSQLPVVLFRGKARLLQFAPQDGLEVLVRGSISVYEDRGQLQLVAEHLEPRGKGSLQVAFEQLYARLKEEGLFDTAAKRPLPAYPGVIGVITSPKGAVIHDMLNVLTRRHAKVQVLLYPAAVQGEAAIGEVTAALGWFQQNACADVLIVARGGGSLEDMAAFNSEAVARAIFASEIPVVSAVGHETDFTIADFAADLRAPTPSAAAELVTDALYGVENHLTTLTARLERAARYQRMQARERLAKLDTAAVFARMQHGMGRRQQRLDELRYRLESNWSRVRAGATQRMDALRSRLMRQDVTLHLAMHRERFGMLQETLAQTGRFHMERRRAGWARAADRLTALSPLAVLDRGYALVYSETSTKLVKSSSVLQTGDGLQIRFARGRARAQVLEAEKEP